MHRESRRLFGWMFSTIRRDVVGISFNLALYYSDTVLFTPSSAAKYILYIFKGVPVTKV